MSSSSSVDMFVPVVEGHHQLCRRRRRRRHQSPSPSPSPTNCDNSNSDELCSNGRETVTVAVSPYAKKHDDNESCHRHSKSPTEVASTSTTDTDMEESDEDVLDDCTTDIDLVEDDDDDDDDEVLFPSSNKRQRRKPSSASSASRSSSFSSTSSYTASASLSFSSSSSSSSDETTTTTSTPTVTSYLSQALSDRGFPDRINPRALDQLHLWGELVDCGGGWNRVIPQDVIHALEDGNHTFVGKWLTTIQHSSHVSSLTSFRTTAASTSGYMGTTSNQTLLHLICWFIGMRIAGCYYPHSTNGRNNDDDQNDTTILNGMFCILDDLLAFDDPSSSSSSLSSSSSSSAAVRRSSSLFVQDDDGRTPIHSLILGMMTTAATSNSKSHSFIMSGSQVAKLLQQTLDRLLLAPSATNDRDLLLLLFTDTKGKTPLEYLYYHHNPEQQQQSRSMQEMDHGLVHWMEQSYIVDRIVNEWTKNIGGCTSFSVPTNITPGIPTTTMNTSPNNVIAHNGSNNGIDVDTTTSSGTDAASTSHTTPNLSTRVNRWMTSMNPFQMRRQHQQHQQQRPFNTFIGQRDTSSTITATTATTTRQPPLSATEQIDHILDLSGLTASINEVGFSV